jgi:5-methylcytosine-specific restriction protein A
MSAFLLTWNPARWPWANLAEVIQQTAEGRPYATQWSTGNTRKIARGDRVFLLKQGDEPRGIIAAGRVTSHEVYHAPHYDPQRAAQGDTAPHADVEFERILDPAEALSVADIDQGPLAKVYWQPLASGNELPEAAAEALEERWAKHVQLIDQLSGGWKGTDLG